MPDGDIARTAASVLCPECRVSLAQAALGAHLRQVHQYRLFRGVWRSPTAATEDALAALLTTRPESDAWQILSGVAHEQYGQRASARLASILGAALERMPESERFAVVDAVAVLLAGDDHSISLAAALASEDSHAAHLLALAVMGRLSPPVPPILFQPAQALLLDRRLPESAQLAVTAVLLRSIAREDPRAADFLQAFSSGAGKSQAIDRLRALERRTGSHPAIDAACARLEDQLRMACPRCGAEMRRPDMIRHLWEEHRLVLDGRRVREPWGVVEDWIDAYLTVPDGSLLDRCRTLASRIDPEHGTKKLYRMLMRRGIADAEARAALEQDAAEVHATLCPACWAEVLVPREIEPFVVYQRRGRLSSHGYIVEVAERGLRTRVEVRTPDKVLYRGAEPGRLLTTNGAVLFLAGPPVLLAFILAVVLPRADLLKAVPAALGIAVAIYLVVQVAWRINVPAAERVRNYAWAILAPRLHAAGFNSEDGAFLAGLANLCTGDGHGYVREEFLPALLTRTERAVVRGLAPPGFLAPLLRLAIEDEAAGGDPVPRVADELARCFEGKLPLAVAERLLADWEADWWTKENLARLRILLCDRAFAAGFEIRNLLDAGQNSPALAEVLGTDHPYRLASLRLLWSQRATRPWDRCGESRTVFEMAEDLTYGPLLAQHADLLLHQMEPMWQVVADEGTEKMGPARILLTARGVHLQDVEFVAPPGSVEVRGKMLGFELCLGDRIFRGPDPLDELAKRMERWFRFAFLDFLPQTTAVINWKPPDRAALLRAWGTLPCPECATQVLPRVGEPGLALPVA